MESVDHPSSSGQVSYDAGFCTSSLSIVYMSVIEYLWIVIIITL